jgi:hypothetical protein
LLFPLSCQRYGKPLREIGGETVYGLNGKETALTGDVLARKNDGSSLKAGTLEYGKIYLRLPDFDTFENANSFYSKIELGFPDLKITPEDAEWAELNYSADFTVSAGGEEGACILKPGNRTGTVKAVFACFTKNVAVKGGGTFPDGAAYDVDIKASKGWNMLYVEKSAGRVSVKSGGKITGDIKWFAVRERCGNVYAHKSPWKDTSAR